jgi:hypothetical protein
MNKLYIYVALAALVSIVVVASIVFAMQKKTQFIGNGFSMDLINSYSSSITENAFIVPPKIENDFSISFWIYIDDHYENHLYWKHIFHKGTLRTDQYDYKYWYNIESQIPQQCIGMWMHPNKNDMRVAITTMVDTDHPVISHPFYEVTSKSKKKNVYKESLETCDILDIPSKTPVNIVVTVEGQTVSIYRDGKLHKTCGLNGKPILNVGDMYFHNQKTYSGKLYDFMYLPRRITKKHISNIYKTMPANLAN